MARLQEKLSYVTVSCDSPAWAAPLFLATPVFQTGAGAASSNFNYAWDIPGGPRSRVKRIELDGLAEGCDGFRQPAKRPKQRVRVHDQRIRVLGAERQGPL